jgi:uncharacterized protein with FMN-binding domain
MRRITTWLLGTISALVLLFSYHTSTSSATSTSVVAERDTGTTSSGGSTDAGSSGSTDAGSSGSTESGSSGSTDSGSSSGSSSSSSTTYTGDAVSTRYGDVQVEITVEDGTVTAAEVTTVPWSNPKDQQINSHAVPILNSETVDVQSAEIDMVSGATYTSEGYIESLQSALDQANL